MKVYGVVGWKNSGKTTLVERLVAEIVSRGFSVSTLKHAHHGFDLDPPGKDSRRHREAGAREVVVSSGRRWAMMHELRGAPEARPDDLIAKLSPVDLVIVEGWKAEGHPKIEAHRAATGKPLIAPGDPTIRAVASDDDVTGFDQPRLMLSDPAAVADFLLRDAGLT